ncbi:hypothetical protein Peur_032921 [Populus x canadensis]
MKEPETIMFLLNTSHGSSSGSTTTTTTSNAIIDSINTMVYPVHIFPEIHPIPSFSLKVSRVSAHQVESYRAQERDERRELRQSSSTRVLHIQDCTTKRNEKGSREAPSSLKVIWLEFGKAMTDLIPFLNMRKLVLGTSKSINPRHIFTCNL